MGMLSIARCVGRAPLSRFGALLRTTNAKRKEKTNGQKGDINIRKSLSSWSFMADRPEGSQSEVRHAPDWTGERPRLECVAAFSRGQLNEQTRRAATERDSAG